MRFPILRYFLSVAAIGPAMAIAAMCDDTYNLQSVTLTQFEGSDAKALPRKSTQELSPSLAGLNVLDTLMRYAVITRFEGSCTKAAKPVTLKVKPSGAKAFTDSVDNGYQVQMFDSSTMVDSLKYNFWFGFFKPAETLSMFFGRNNAQGPAFVGWYVGIAYTDSTKDSSGLWKVRPGVFYHLTGPDDSMALEKRVLDATIRKQPSNSGTYRAWYRVQFLKVSYENKPAPNRVMPPHRALPSAFLARQTGNLVLIQIGDKSAGSEPLGIYNMLGSKVASVHPIGAFYQWNGKTAIGSDAPAGVYFVQAGNRVLGKFFYSP